MKDVVAERASAAGLLQPMLVQDDPFEGMSPEVSSVQDLVAVGSWSVYEVQEQSMPPAAP